MIKSIKERVLVRLVEVPKEEKKVLIMPDEKKEYQIGLVISIGADLGDWQGFPQYEIKPGDYVWSRKYSGLLLEYKGEEYVSLDIKEILAVSEELA